MPGKKCPAEREKLGPYGQGHISLNILTGKLGLLLTYHKVKIRYWVRLFLRYICITLVKNKGIINAVEI